MPDINNPPNSNSLIKTPYAFYPVQEPPCISGSSWGCTWGNTRFTNAQSITPVKESTHVGSTDDGVRKAKQPWTRLSREAVESPPFHLHHTVHKSPHIHRRDRGRKVRVEYEASPRNWDQNSYSYELFFHMLILLCSPAHPHTVSSKL